MKILLTGASGFLGAALKRNWINEHQVLSVGRSVNSDFVADLSESIPTLPNVEMVVHAAGKAHLVPANAKEKEDFFNVNVNGTKNLLEALSCSDQLPHTFVFISSVAVYGVDAGEHITEKAPLLAEDAYGKSKIEAEQIIKAWGKTKSVQVIILRLPLIIGMQPPGNLGAMIKAIRAGYYFRIGEGNAKRSVVNVNDLATFIPKLNHKTGTYNLTEFEHPKISEIDHLIATQLNKKIKSLPKSVAVMLALLGDIIPGIPLNSKQLGKLTQSLTFSSELAQQTLGWNPGGMQNWEFLQQH